jgi:hypothetical protein
MAMIVIAMISAPASVCVCVAKARLVGGKNDGADDGRAFSDCAQVIERVLFAGRHVCAPGQRERQQYIN